MDNVQVLVIGPGPGGYVAAIRAAQLGVSVALVEKNEDLRRARCDFLTIGQYLRPSKNHAPVVRFVPPEEFVSLETKAKQMGFSAIASAPFVRSSYKSGEFLRKLVS